MKFGGQFISKFANDKEAKIAERQADKTLTRAILQLHLTHLLHQIGICFF